MIPSTSRIALATFAASLALAFAQQPVQSPVYYVSTAPALVEGVPVEGALTRESGRNFKDGSRLDVLVLRGALGESVEVRVESDDFDTYLTVYAPDGSVLDTNDDDFTSDVAYASTLRLDLPSTGTYLVVVSGYFETDLGRYTVTRTAYERPEPVRVDVALPGRYEGGLAPEGTNVYLLELAAPATLRATLRSKAFDAYLEVFDDEGTWLAANDDFDGTDSEVLVDLEAGVYEIEVSAYFDSGEGAYTLDLDW
jgi:hypothetical protein